MVPWGLTLNRCQMAAGCLSLVNYNPIRDKLTDAAKAIVSARQLDGSADKANDDRLGRIRDALTEPVEATDWRWLATHAEGADRSFHSR
jgi:hypothetical protein